PAAAKPATSCQRRRSSASISRSWESRVRDGRGSELMDGYATKGPGTAGGRTSSRRMSERRQRDARADADHVGEEPVPGVRHHLRRRGRDRDDVAGLEREVLRGPLPDGVDVDVDVLLGAAGLGAPDDDAVE